MYYGIYHTEYVKWQTFSQITLDKQLTRHFGSCKCLAPDTLLPSILPEAFPVIK